MNTPADEAGRWSIRAVAVRLVVAVLLLMGVTVGTATATVGVDWTPRAATEDNSWYSVAYGNGVFVAVAGDGTNRVMTSTDGENWTAHNAAEANGWISVAYGNGLFVAVAYDGTNRVMTSTDGENWTAHNAAEANGWYSVMYGNGMFVAVATDGTNRVMTSNPALLTQAGAASDTMTLVPPSGTAPTEYRIHYNTQARIDGSQAWGNWAKTWNTSALSIDLATYQTAGVGNCSGMAVACFRPAAIGEQTSGTSRVYRVLANQSGTWITGPPMTVTRP